MEVNLRTLRRHRASRGIPALVVMLFRVLNLSYKSLCHCDSISVVQPVRRSRQAAANRHCLPRRTHDPGLQMR